MKIIFFHIVGTYFFLIKVALLKMLIKIVGGSLKDFYFYHVLFGRKNLLNMFQKLHKINFQHFWTCSKIFLKNVHILFLHVYCTNNMFEHVQIREHVQFLNISKLIKKCFLMF